MVIKSVQCNDYGFVDFWNRKLSIIPLPIGKTSKVTTQQEDYLDWMNKKPSFLHIGVLHLKSFVWEWKLATILNYYPSVTQQVRYTIWLQMASTVQPVLVVKNGSHLLMVHLFKEIAIKKDSTLNKQLTDIPTFWQG